MAFNEKSKQVDKITTQGIHLFSGMNLYLTKIWTGHPSSVRSIKLACCKVSSNVKVSGKRIILCFFVQRTSSKRIGKGSKISIFNLLCLTDTGKACYKDKFIKELQNGKPFACLPWLNFMKL